MSTVTGGSATATGGSNQSSSSSYTSTTVTYSGSQVAQCPEISVEGAIPGIMILVIGLLITMGRRRA